MSKASILRQLSDEDLEAVHHMIRRDAEGDLKIAQDAESRGKKADKNFLLGPTDAAKAMVVARYRQSPIYRRWLQSYENRWVDLQKSVALERERLEAVRTLVGTVNESGFEDLSKNVQARLLIEANTIPIDQLKEAASGNGWASNVIKITEDCFRDQLRRKVEELKAEIERIMNAPKGKAVKTEDLVETVDKVMGIKK
jgi:hypothetical protein